MGFDSLPNCGSCACTESLSPSQEVPFDSPSFSLSNHPNMC
ncbi:hypothetical protein RvY_04306 [Ramazzottius varieornatus]|uniref:Uncharacterized protein n=1 Tax=Ramazzottius varieornatus TaxID=947166 RepID=A0A1D1V0G2_RAMVA|nr:hypothetical protein RvY_04306 [Ramazzottius varieornatus]